MKQLLYSRLQADAELAEVVGDRIYESSALGVGDVPASPAKPYILYTELPSSPYRDVRETSRAKARIFQIWCYDERGSFIRIERVLALVRETLLGSVAEVSPSGARCTDVEWQGESSDIVDVPLDSNAKFVLIRFTASQ